MSLNWNVAKITAREGQAFVWPACGPNDEQVLRGEIECMIWATMFVGLNKITEANAEAFAARLASWEAIAGPISASGKPLSAALVRKCVGLETNANTLTAAAFQKQLGKVALARAERAAEKAARASQEAR